MQVIGVTELNPDLSHLSSTKVRKLLAENKASRSGDGDMTQKDEEHRAAIVQVVGSAVADFLLGLPAEVVAHGNEGESRFPETIKHR